MSRTVEPAVAAPAVTSSPPTKKRKRTTLPEEVEVDINAAEPPSKKALRAAKKAEKRKSEPKQDATSADDKPDVKIDSKQDATEAKSVPASAEKRSQYGIWIGNLPFSATRDSLRTFLKDYGSIETNDITRVNMPVPNVRDSGMRVKPTNKGFAYVDFTGPEILEKALELSETLMGGRKVLIKNAHSFEGRPEKKKEEKEPEKTAKPASKRIFVGNLSFDVTKEDLSEHFRQAGEIEDVHMATFEDSGKCKGFAWIKFAELEAAESAVKGFIFKKTEDDDEDEESDEAEATVGAAASTPADAADSSDESESGSDAKAKPVAKPKKGKKKMKWFINRMHSRPLRCEFAEDSQSRYKKRFGSAKTDVDGDADSSETRPRSRPKPIPSGDAELNTHVQDAATARLNRKSGLDKEQRRAERSKRHLDARSIKPGQALANAPRASGAIVAGAGKKTTFE